MVGKTLTFQGGNGVTGGSKGEIVTISMVWVGW